MNTGKSGIRRNRFFSPLRIAYFSPLPPNRSGIADYSRELLPYLSRHAEISLFVPDPEQVSSALQTQFPIYPINSYQQKRWQFDIALYQMGNSIHHEVLYRTFLRFPSIVVLHDYFLHHFLIRLSVKRNEFSVYSREMGYALGLKGIDIAWGARMGYQEYRPFDVPLNNRVIDLGLGLIVHSNYVQSCIEQQHKNKQVITIPHLVSSRPQTSLREKLRVPAGTVVFASAGHIRPDKQIDMALRCFGRLKQIIPDIYYLIIGEETSKLDLSFLIRDLGLQNAVMQTGFVSDLQTFVDWIGTADVIVNLRYPTVGETSGVALRALAAAKPIIVSDHGWYSELPNNACIKVPPLDEDALLAAMLAMARNPEKREKMGQAALGYVETGCNPARVAEAYISFIDQLLRRYRV